MHDYLQTRYALSHCRFDFPEQWATLLADLTAAASWENVATSVAGKGRALFTLKNTLWALRGKRIVVETPRSSISMMSPQGAPSMLSQSGFLDHPGCSGLDGMSHSKHMSVHGAHFGRHDLTAFGELQLELCARNAGLLVSQGTAE